MTLSKLARSIPRLAETVGRVGDVGDGPAVLHVVGLGDSVAAGAGVERGEDTMAGRLAHRLAGAGKPVSWAIHARGGLTAAGVSALLDRPDVTGDLAEADVVLVSVGVNDLLRLRRQARWRRDLGALLARVRSTSSGEVVLLGMPPVAAFPSLPGPVRGVLGRLAERMDDVGREVARRCDVQHLALPADLLLTDGAFAADGFHPSSRSHDRLAEVVASRLPPLTNGAVDVVR
ncbi:MAG: SGNH/GDSL hydrolase family protein [Nocardioides sp.]